MGRLFGTNGVRGVVGEDMTPELALRLGRAIGTWADGPVLVGRDSRTSGPMLFDALTAGIRAAGTEAFDAGMVPTPAIQYAVEENEYAAGAIVTASHNPPEYNGIKVCKDDGTELVENEVANLESVYFDEGFNELSWDTVAKLGEDSTVSDAYEEAVVDELGEDKLGEEPPTVVVDCANGAAAKVAPNVLRRLGADVVALNAQPDGSFPGHPSEPTPENLADTIETVQALDADFGVAFDGDADRCVFITGEGEYVPGERTLALVAGAMVEDEGEGLVVTPVSSSQAVADHVESHGGEVRYTAVGSPVVADVMKEERALFGGEENGGLIFPDHQYCRDGTMTAAWLTHHLANADATFAELLEEIRTYRLVKQSVDCPDEHKQDVLDAFADTVDADEVDTTDGVKAFYKGGWVLVRPSGTEPLMRVYAEARDEDDAQRLGDDALERVEGIVDDVRKG
jgi:phosphoglucosamine mutase